MATSHLVMRVEDGGDTLVIELRVGDGAQVEALAPGVSLERDATGTPLRMILRGLTAQQTTNAFMSPMVRCGDQAPVTGPSGAACFWLCLLPHERQDRVFHPVPGPRVNPTGPA